MKNSIRSPPLRKDTLDDTWDVGKLILEVSLTFLNRT
jgi:hypothetical protein